MSFSYFVDFFIFIFLLFTLHYITKLLFFTSNPLIFVHSHSFRISLLTFTVNYVGKGSVFYKCFVLLLYFQLSLLQEFFFSHFRCVYDIVDALFMKYFVLLQCIALQYFFTLISSAFHFFSSSLSL